MKYLITGNVGDMGVKLTVEEQADDVRPPAPPPQPDPPPPAGDGTDHNADPFVFSSRPGSFHRPTKEAPVLSLNTKDLTPPPGKYSRINVEMDFIHGGWSPDFPNKRHNIFWLAKNGNFDMFGYVMGLGPGTNKLRMAHGLQVKHDKKLSVDKAVRLKPGLKYHIEYEYDMEQRTVRLILTDISSAQPKQLLDVTDVTNLPDDHFVIGDKDKMRMDFGFTGEEDTEPASLGWSYQDLHVEFTPAT
jgi:hypothetical protein